MSVIFPGNYVAHLNAYRDQGVFALPGVEFYQLRGQQSSRRTKPVAVFSNSRFCPPTCVKTTSPVWISLRDCPAGAVVYRSAINVENLAASGTETVAVDGLTVPGLEASLAAVGGVFPESGASTAFDGFAPSPTEAADATITALTSGDPDLVDPDSQAAVLVEVCYYLDGDCS